MPPSPELVAGAREPVPDAVGDDRAPPLRFERVRDRDELADAHLLERTGG